MVIVLVALGATVVVFGVLDCLGYKLVKPKEEKPSYISDMEHELGVARLDLEASTEVLRAEISQVVARELPKAVKAGKHNLTIELYAKEPNYIAGEAGLPITPSQLSVLNYHNLDDKWAKEKLIDHEIAKYISAVGLYVHNLREEEYASLHLLLD